MEVGYTATWVAVMAVPVACMAMEHGAWQSGKGRDRGLWRLHGQWYCEQRGE